MKIKLSKSQWQQIGKTAGWMGDVGSALMHSKQMGDDYPKNKPKVESFFAQSENAISDNGASGKYGRELSPEEKQQCQIDLEKAKQLISTNPELAAQLEDMTVDITHPVGAFMGVNRSPLTILRRFVSRNG